MKLNDYIYKTKKTYQFKIGIVDDLPDDFENNLENCLQKYKLLNFSAKHVSPVQANPLDFPLHKNTSVNYWDVEVEYPTYSEALRTYIGQYCGIPISNIAVRRPDEPITEYQKTADAGEYKTLLTQPDMGGESAQHLVGQSRVMELLKELQKEEDK